MTGHYIPETPLTALLRYTAPLAPAICKYTSLALLLTKKESPVDGADVGH